MRKKNIPQYLLVAAVLLSAAMSACTVKNEVKPDSSVQWDPISLKIYIKDTNNFDLLDTTPENYAGDQLTIKFKNKQYKINYPKIAKDEFNYEELQVEKTADSSLFCAKVANLDGSVNYDDDFLVLWKVKKPEKGQPSSTQNIIHLRHTIYKNQSKTSWLIDDKNTGIESYTAAFEILVTFK